MKRRVRYVVMVFRPMVQKDLEAMAQPNHGLVRLHSTVESSRSIVRGDHILIDQFTFNENPLNDPENMVWISDRLVGDNSVHIEPTEEWVVE